MAVQQNILSSTQLHSTDIFSSVMLSNTELLDFVAEFANAASKNGDGIIKIPGSGQELDISSLAGMSAFGAQLKLMEAHNEIINSTLNFIKNLENKLDNLLGQ
jgi:hypothetical protein